MVLERRDEDTKKTRIEIQARIVDIYKAVSLFQTRLEWKNEFKDTIRDGRTDDGKWLWNSVSSIQKTDEYITIGNYKAHKTKLIGGKLQMRCNNNNQIHNLKSQIITKNIRDKNILNETQ